MTFFDQYSDASRAVLVKLAGRAASAKTVDRLLEKTVGEWPPLKKEAFALPEKRMFPVDTKENTELSLLYFDGQRGQIAAALGEEKTASLEGVLEKYRALHGAKRHKLASPQVKEAEDAREPVELLEGVEVASTDDARRAAADFEAGHAKLAVKDRVKFARRFRKLAREWKLPEVPASVNIYAGRYPRSGEEIRTSLLMRKAAALRQGKDGAEFEKLAEALTNRVLHDAPRRDMRALAEIIQALDLRYDFDAEKWDSRLPDAYKTVFMGKRAEMAQPARQTPSGMSKADIIAKLGHGALDEVENDDGTIDVPKLTRIMRAFGVNAHA
jgi:hypothetical protein